MKILNFKTLLNQSFNNNIVKQRYHNKLHFPLKMIEMLEDEQQINQELTNYEKVIFQKIQIIRELLHEEDKAVVEEIIMKKNHSTDPSTFLLSIFSIDYPKYDKKTCYYQEFWKVYLLNEIMISKIKDYSVNNKQIASEIQTLQEAEKQWNQLWIQKSKKKLRRTSDMIDKSFKCPFPDCSKPYGSDVSLNLHMKLKHNSGTKTERQALAKQICLGQLKGHSVQIDLTFPPGYLEDFRKNFRVESSIP